MIELAEVAPLLGEHLARQRWFADEPPGRVEIVASERWLDGDPTMWWLLVDAFANGDGDGGTGEVGLGRYQLVLGMRSGTVDHDFLHGKTIEVLGATEGGVVVYDATVDAELALHLLERVCPGVPATSVRPLTVEQSNTSVVFDEHLIVKLFRRVRTETNPDVDMVARLTEVGFTHVPAQLGVLSRDGQDLAVARAFLTGASDGWALALTSLRVLFADGEAADLPGPAASGGDFGPEAHRLGGIAADLHLHLAEAYGTTEAHVSAWVAHFRAQLDRSRSQLIAEALDPDEVAARYDVVSRTTAPGPGIRIHGDLHLGQVMRADSGWFVLDFEGEPARPVAERVAPSSPLRDIAGMLRSFHYAAEVASWEHAPEDVDVLALAQAWEERARTLFLDGYRSTPGIDALLPDEATAEALLAAFELDKAVYELVYEAGHRPTWTVIPVRALERLLT